MTQKLFKANFVKFKFIMNEIAKNFRFENDPQKKLNS